MVINEFEEISNGIELILHVFDVAIVIPVIIFKIKRERGRGPTVLVCLNNNFTVKTIAVFLLLFTYQTCISHSVSSRLSCSVGIIAGAVLPVVASHFIQILNGSYGTVSYTNALKPKDPGQTHLPEKLRAEPPFPIYKDILCICGGGGGKCLERKLSLPFPLLINNCLGKEHPSMVKKITHHR